MPLAVTSRFTAAEAADVNFLASQIYLVLGNYSSSPAYSATATSSGAAANYPASGAIDGDRTEINVGAAASADNGVGQSSWKSSAVPSSGSPVTLDIDLVTSRVFNRIKLYHRSGNGLKTYTLSYWDGTQWIVFAGTNSAFGSGGGYGDPAYGDTPYGGGIDSLTADLFDSTGTLDVIDFTTDVTSSKIRLTVYKAMNSANPAEVVEFEVYRKVDITSRVIAFETSRERDYKLNNNLAAEATVTVDNSDRFFSPSHTPSTAETTAGFVNSELRPGLGLIVKGGFTFNSGAYGYGDGPYGDVPYGGVLISPTSTETVGIFTGTLDSLRVSPGRREAVISARDGIKNLLDRTLSTKLKSSQAIETNLQYILNLCNISTFEMSLDATTITLDYFFLYSQTVMTAVQELVQACGDAQFYFDESGLATLRMYLNNVPQQRVVTSYADWAAGTVKTSVDVESHQGQVTGPWVLFDDFADATPFAARTNPPNAPTWVSTTTSGAGSIFASLGGLRANIGNGPNAWAAADAAFTQATGVYRFILNITAISAPAITNGGDGGSVVFMSNAGSVAGGGGVTLKGYGLRFNMNYDGSNNQVQLMKWNSQGITGGTVLANLGTFTTGAHTWTITRDGSGNMTVYKDGTSVGTATDNTFVACSYFTLAGQNSSTASNFSGILDDVYYTPLLTDPLEGIFESAVYDQAAAITSEGIFQATYTPYTGGTINFYTATSADGVTFDAYEPATPGSLIASTTRRYIKFKITFDTALAYYSPNIPLVTDVTLNWFTGTGSSKARTEVDFTFQYSDVLLGLEQEMADNLGGDTAIVNDVAVASSPLVLSGTDADVQWQGTVGTPAAAVAAGNPYTVAIGTYTFNCIVPDGMDTTNMSGANPAAAAITFAAGAAGTWAFSLIHPTKPILVITITNPGTMTDLRLIGKKFTAANTPYQATSSDTQSQAFYSQRSLAVVNNFIINSGIAATIAARLISNYSDPISYIPSATVRPTYSVSLGDRITLVDLNTDLNTDHTVIGVRHRFVAQEDGLEAQTDITLVKIT